jgi:hypothetical protein
MSKQDEADLILKLYDLRREATMRKARDWFFVEFNPESRADVEKTMFSDKGGYLRMIVSYWDMAAALVNHGAISKELFADTNNEYVGVFSKLEPFLGELRASYPMLHHLEKLIDAMPDGRKQVAETRERMQRIRAEFLRAQAGGASRGA